MSAGRAGSSRLWRMDESSILQLYEKADFCETWTQTEEGFAADHYESDFFVDTTMAIRDHILQLAETRGLSKRQLRRTQGVLSELIMNAERHMTMPFYASFTLACFADNTLAFIVENSALERAYDKARVLLVRILGAVASGAKDEIDAVSDDLLNQPGKGGMGFWNITTQFQADLWVIYSPQTQRIKSYCLIPPGGSK